MEKKNVYSLKSVKSFRGMEGLGFNATLLKNGKPVAFVMDEAVGADYCYEWNDFNAPKVTVEHTLHNGEKHQYKVTPEHAEFLAFCGEQDSDSVIAKMVDEFEETKKIKRLVKKNIVIRFKGQEEGTYSYFKKPWDSTAKGWIENWAKTNGKEIEVIYNETVL